MTVLDVAAPHTEGAPELPELEHLSPRLVLSWWWMPPLFVFYVAMGVFFAMRGVFMGDALARTTAANQVIHGFDPHIASIGFVWGPIPTVLEIPLIWLIPLKQMVTDGIAGSVVSAAFAILAVASLRGILHDRRLPKTTTLVIVLAFAFNPFIVIFASNGMSEMPYVALLLAATRRLLRFEADNHTTDAAIAGVYLAVGTLVRYEPLLAALGAAAFAFIHARRMASGTPRQRTRSGAVAGVAVLAPVLVVFGLFITISWWITGVAVAQLSSAYGNAAIIAAVGISVYASIRVPEVATEVIAISPLLIPMVLVDLALTTFRRRYFLTVVLVVLLPPLAFDILGLSTGTQLNLNRYLILEIPLASLALAAVIDWIPDSIFPRRFLGASVATLVALAVSIVSVSAASATISSPRQSSQEYAYSLALRGDSNAYLHSDLQLQAAKNVAAWIDSQNLPPGSVMTDSFLGFMVISQSSHPERFITAPATTYRRAILDPYHNGITYLIAVPPQGTGALYPLNIYYPGLYSGCLAHTALRLVADGTGTPTEWRIYKLTGTVTPSKAYIGPHCPIHRVVLGS